IVPGTSPQSYGVVLPNGPVVAQAFTFSAFGVCGSTLSARFQLLDGARDLGIVTFALPLGQQVTNLVQFFDAVTAPALPAGWTSTAAGVGSPWTVQTQTFDSPPNAAYCADVTDIGHGDLVSPEFVITGARARLVFRNHYDLEATTGNLAYDGGVLEIKVGAGNFVDITETGAAFVSGGYNKVVAASYGNVLAGRDAWSGNSGGFITTIIDLPETLMNQPVTLRWRCGSDDATRRTGWRIDNVHVYSATCCGGTPPVLPTLPDILIPEMLTAVITNTVVAPGLPAATLDYSLLDAPVGAQIDVTGVIRWTPAENQGPSTNLVSTVVVNSLQPALRATNSFTIIVTESNRAPLLPVHIDPWIVSEGSLLVLTNAATDPDWPTNALTYSLLDAPAGVAVDADGRITWIPGEAQGPSTNAVIAIAIDDGVPALSVTNSFIIVVMESNAPPVLPSQQTVTIPELRQLVITNRAVDPDIPANGMTYALLAAPTGAAIDTDGVITWTPNELQGPGTNAVITVVTDNGVPALRATNLLMVVVTETNAPPVLPVQETVTIFELRGLIVTNRAADPDVPTNNLTYALISAPTGASIDTEGLITWTPGEAQGPGTNILTTVVSDNGEPVLKATNSFTVIVLESNSPPVLPIQADVTLTEWSDFAITNGATDADVPTNSLAYALLAGPAEATIDSAGVIRWSPKFEDTMSTNVFTTVVTDNGVPSLSATNSFTLTMSAVVERPVLAMPVVVPELGSVVLRWASISGRTYRLEYKENCSDGQWESVTPDIVATGTATAITNTLNQASQRYYRLTLLP
ncbi:MAG TPA: hypothetical protein VN673_01805, partial [Clostridia bacterium]|nr:hypothetical protein [Clostridia bacterium]